MPLTERQALKLRRAAKDDAFLALAMEELAAKDAEIERLLRENIELKMGPVFKEHKP